MKPSVPLLRILLLLGIAVSFYYNLQAVPLFDVDEGAFSEATREMFVRGDFISPYLNGVPRFDKPVFIHWMQALSVVGLGLNEFALRLPSAIAATLWVLVVYLGLRRRQEEADALLAALMMTLSLEIPLLAKAATADATLNLFITSSMLTAYFHYQDGGRRWLYATSALMALGFLTKGPIAVLIPVAVTSVFYLSRGAFRTWVRTALHPGALLLFLVMVLPWYLAEYLKEGEAFLRGFFFKHNIGRFENPMEGHSGSLFYYVPVVLLGILPYTALLLRVLASARSHWQQDFSRYLLIWFGFVFLFFSLSGTKLPHYVVYGYAPLFVLMAWEQRRLSTTVWLFLPPLLLFSFLLALPEVCGLALPHIKNAYFRSMLADYGHYFGDSYRLYFAVALLITLYFSWERRILVSYKLVACGFLVSFGVSAQVMPVIAALQQAPIKEAALLAKAHHYRVVMWRLNAPSFDVYAERLVEKRHPRPGDVVLTKSIYSSELPAAEKLYEKNGIALLYLPLP